MPSFSNDPFQYLRKRAIGAIAGGGSIASAIPTYAQYQAAIATLATNGVIAWTANLSPGTYRTISAAQSATTMAGSSWAASLSNEGQSPVNRVVLHGLPSATVMNDQAAQNREIIIRSVVVGIPVVLASVNRNSYTSVAAGSPGDERAAQSVRFVGWYDDILGPLKDYPAAGLGPIPWDMVSTVY